MRLSGTRCSILHSNCMWQILIVPTHFQAQRKGREWAQHETPAIGLTPYKGKHVCLEGARGCLQFWKFLHLPNQHLMITDAFTSHDHNP